MNKTKLSRFENSNKYLICPICAAPLSLREKSLYCESGHCFDIAKQGYVNLAMSGHKAKNYDKESFKDRHLVLEGGYYNHILQEVMKIISEIYGGKEFSLLDVACGEGYYSREASKLSGAEVLAFDLSKDSIQLAAKSDAANAVKWFVGDLSKIPVANKTIDCILDIFSPANYNEFGRILKDDGIIIKVIPGKSHLSQLREAVKDNLINKTYSNDDIIEYFEEHADIIIRRSSSATYHMPPEDLSAFKRMTPLLFNIEQDIVDSVSVAELTVEGEILVGKIKDIKKTL